MDRIPADRREQCFGRTRWLAPALFPVAQRADIDVQEGRRLRLALSNLRAQFLDPIASTWN
jgi:hypothetical protein